MKLIHYKLSDLVSKKWSGGTTTELVVFPENSDYQKRNFIFRISTAKIETEQSDFTKLPGIKRKLMVLDGEIKIIHDGFYTKTLKKFDQDEFIGDWKTRSIGMGIDFNLMTRNEANGILKAHVLEQNQEIFLNVPNSIDFASLYCFKGVVHFTLIDINRTINTGEFVAYYADYSHIIKVIAMEHSEIILTLISLSNPDRNQNNA